MGPNVDEIAELESKIATAAEGRLLPPFLLLTRQISPGYITVPVHLFRCTFAKANYRNKVPRGLRPIGPLLDAFGVGSDVNYRQTFCRKHEALTKGSVGLLTALLVIK